MKRNKQLFILMGAPGSGKSTWTKLQLKPSDVYVSRDQIRFNLLKENDSYFSKEKEVYKTFVSNIVKGLQAVGKTRVFADASHLTAGSRMKLINALKKVMDLSDVDISVIWIKTTLETCIKRNDNRTGRANVSHEIISQMWHSQTMPTAREGIKKVYVVDEKQPKIKLYILDRSN